MKGIGFPVALILCLIGSVAPAVAQPSSAAVPPHVVDVSVALLVPPAHEAVVDRPGLSVRYDSTRVPRECGLAVVMTFRVVPDARSWTTVARLFCGRAVAVDLDAVPLVNGGRRPRPRRVRFGGQDVPPPPARVAIAAWHRDVDPDSVTRSTRRRRPP
jgi:hypothetical protein